MTLDTIILVFTAVANLSLGLFILLRNPKLRSSIAFFALSASITSWAIANYLTESANFALSANILFNRLAYIFGLWCLLSAVVFCYSFPSRIIISKTKATLFVLLVAITSALSVTDLVAGRVTKGAEGLHFSVGILSIPYAFLLVSLLAISAHRLLRSKRSSTKQVRSQINLIVWGFCLSALFAVFMNIVLPNIVDSFKTAKFGPLLTVSLVATTTYAIVKHRLFDIKLIVARSLAYLLLIATGVGTYSIITFGVAIQLFGDNNFSRRVVPLFLAFFLAFTIQPLKKFFDRITNRFFYRDAYDSQVFLDQFNKVLVATYELNPLLVKSAEIIERNLKPSFAIFCINETEGNPKRVIATASHTSLTEQDMTELRKTTAHIHAKLIDADELSDRHIELQKLLRENNVAIVVRLTSSLQQEGVGYLLLGTKKSGNPYSSQDVGIIEILANELVIAVQNSLSFEEIQTFNLTLQSKVDEQTHKLRQANEKLKSLDEAKDDFISMASHQLRTPLTVIKGYTSMLLEGGAGDPLNKTEDEFLRQTFNSAQRMAGLISDLLNLSRLKTGKFVVEREPCNLADIIDEEMEQLKEIAESRELTLSFDKPKDFPVVNLDEVKTRQVIMNFIDNAIYYTREGGHIDVELEETKDDIIFRVKDNGIGVPDDQKDNLFTKFYRAENAKTARPNGTGIGLFMAKKAVEVQGGTVIFESTYNVGSTFGFKFSKAGLASAQQSGAEIVEVTEK